jgi:hypothetical protein
LVKIILNKAAEDKRMILPLEPEIVAIENRR